MREIKTVIVELEYPRGDCLRDYSDEYYGIGRELIRCKDCKNWEKNDWNPNGMCRAFDDGSVCVLTETDKDEYCARAERKDNER